MAQARLTDANLYYTEQGQEILYDPMAYMLRSLLVTTLSCFLLLLGPPGLRGDSQDSSRDRVVVIGAGIAGLTAAFLLREKGYEVLVLERNSRPGGRAIAGEFEGLRYAAGTEYLGRPSGPLKKMVRISGLKTVEVPAPVNSRWEGGKFYIGSDAVARLHAGKVGVASYNKFVRTIQRLGRKYEDVPELAFKSPIARLDLISARAFFKLKKFHPFIGKSSNNASRGLFGANLNEISALSFLPELFYELKDAKEINRLEDLDEPTPKIGAYRTDTYSFKGGIARLTERLGRKLGKSLRLNCNVSNVVKNKYGYSISYFRRTGRGNKRAFSREVIQADGVILAVPAPAARRIASKALGLEKSLLLKSVRYSPYVTLALFSRRPIFNKAFDLALPDHFFFSDLYDGSWVERFYNPALRKQNKFVAVLYIAPRSFKDKSLLTMLEEDIYQKALRDLTKVFPDAQSKIVAYKVQRFAQAYPVMTRGAYGRLSRLHKISEGSLQLAGDFMIYPTFEAAAESGKLAAERMIEELD